MEYVNKMYVHQYTYERTKKNKINNTNNTITIPTWQKSIKMFNIEVLKCLKSI
jgi:hypothetical protein